MSFDTPVGHSPSNTRSQRRFVIDCDVCIARSTEACSSCVVTFLVRDEHDGAVIIDLAEARALKALGDGGLVPRLRHATMRE